MSLVSYSPTKSFVLGIGSYVPEKVLGNKELSQKVETSDEWIRTRTGISERRIARSDQATSDLALEAAKKAIESAQIKPSDIDLVIVATITPDMAFPSTACLLQHKLGLGKVACFDIEAYSGRPHAMPECAGHQGRVSQTSVQIDKTSAHSYVCLLYTSPSPRDRG